VSRLAVLSLAFAAACGDPETIVDDVGIEVGLQLQGGACFQAARSVSVQLQEPLGPPDDPLGYCVLRQACVEVEPESLETLDDLALALANHGRFFEGLPAFEDVQLQIRGTPNADCEFPPAEAPTFCGLSGFEDLGLPEAHFQVAFDCGRECQPTWPVCAGAE